MNLIEIQDKLRSMPMQLLQQYANGSNPEVPPYVALGVLQEKQAMAQRMGNAQGAAQGQMPTVKEKVEEASGLMALQQQKQQQAAQQQAAQNMNRPGPVPSGVRPPEAQPTSQEAMPMRAGGLARLRSNLNLARGGIVAFQEGGQSNVSLMQMETEIRRRNPTLSDEEVKRQAWNELHRYDDEGKFVPSYKRPNRESPYKDAGGGILDAIGGYFSDKAKNLPKTPQETEAQWRDGMKAQVARTTTSGLPMTPPQAAKADRARGDVARSVQQDPIINADAEIAGAKAAQEESASQPKPWVEPAAHELPSATQKPAGLPAAAPKLPQAPAAQPQVTAPAEQGPQGIQKAIDAMKKLREASGRGSSKYDAQIQAKMDEMSRAYEDSKKTRDFENMIRFLGGSSKGPQGQVNAYLSNVEMGRAADAAERNRQMQVLEGMRSREQELAKDYEAGARSMFDRQQTVEGSEKTARINAASARETALIRAQAQRDAATIAANARENSDDTKSIQRAEQAFARDPMAVSLRKKLEDPLLTPEEARKAQGQLNAIQMQKYRAFGINVEAALGAQASSGSAAGLPAGVKVTKID